MIAKPVTAAPWLRYLIVFGISFFLTACDNDNNGVSDTYLNGYFFGIEENFDSSDDYVSLSTEDIRDLHVKNARVLGGPFIWDVVEPKKGVFDYTLTDAVVESAGDAHIGLIVTWYPYALWDQNNDPGCLVDGFDIDSDPIPKYRCNPSDWAAHDSVLADLVERYDGDSDFGSQPISEGLKNKITSNPILVWEINNEVTIGDNVEIPRGFMGDLSEYKLQLEHAYNAIKSVCSDCVVLVSACEPTRDPVGYYSELESVGAFDFLDAFNIHGPLHDNVSGFVAAAEKLAYMSEGGGSPGNMVVIEGLNMLKMGFSKAVVAMAPKRDKVDKDKTEEDSFLLDSNGNRTQQFTALSIASGELNGFNDFSEVATDDPELVGLVFEFQDKHDVFVYYLNSKDEFKTFSVTPGFDSFVVKNLYGESSVVSGSFTVGFGNVYFVSKESQGSS